MPTTSEGREGLRGVDEYETKFDFLARMESMTQYKKKIVRIQTQSLRRLLDMINSK